MTIITFEDAVEDAFEAIFPTDVTNILERMRNLVDISFKYQLDNPTYFASPASNSDEHGRLWISYYTLATLAGNYATIHMNHIVRINISELSRVMVSKQRDYGSNNIMARGHLGLNVRLSDKVARFTNLVKTGAEPQNESLRDTVIDIINYCAIGIMLCKYTFTCPLSEDISTNTQAQEATDNANSDTVL